MLQLRMFKDILAFELKRRSGMLSTYVYFLLFALAGFMAMVAAGGAFSGITVGGASDKVAANSPIALHALISVLSSLALLVSAAVFGQAVHQDFETGIHGIYFTTPVQRGSYLGGRFFAAWVFMVGVVSSIGLGLFLGTRMPFVDPKLFSPNRLILYAWPYWVMVWPNLFFSGAVFFALGALTRRMVAVYTASVVLVIGYLTAGQLFGKLENRNLSALVDPFGMRATELATRYWTVAEKNVLRVPFEGLLLENRLIWIGFGVLVLAGVLARFRFAYELPSGKTWAVVAAEEVEVPSAGVVPPTPVTPPRGLGWVPVLVRMTVLGFRETVKSVYFLVIVFAGVLFMVVAAFQAGNLYGTLTYPVTYSVVELVSGTFSIFILILMTFYAGELVWRERDANIDGLVDALPVPTGVTYLSKLLALMLVPVVLMGVMMVTGLGIQTARGYFHYELGLYFKTLFGLDLLGYLLIAGVSVSVQSLLQNKYLGHFVMVAYYTLLLFAGKLGIEHHLLRPLDAPSFTYSDMNGFGHFLAPVLWFNGYWAAFVVVFAILGYLGFARGRETGRKERIAVASQRWTRPVQGLAAVAVLAFLGAGAFIFYNTNHLNLYRNAHDDERAQVDYEKKYRALLKAPQPRITDVSVDLDLVPKQRTLRARGTYAFANKTQVPIRTVYVNLPNDQPFALLSVAGVAKPTRSDARLGFYSFDLLTPLLPGATGTVTFDLTFEPHGFKNEGDDTEIVANGTFFHSTRLPSLGYQEGEEVSEDGTRKKYGLAPKPRMADLDDVAARQNNYISSDADWVTFRATVSTDPDQIALAPGYLEREWSENGRRYFSYVMDSKILNFWSVLSARYAVKRDTWKGVALEIYYHPTHTWDLEQMMRGMKAALEYDTVSFGPYQHRQVRILEFPRYAAFAQSFPNTIPYSEQIGFIAKEDPQDKEDVHFPFFVTAHEVSHQWWAHQVVGGNVQGATLLSESFSEYSALMTMKKAFGDFGMKRFLHHELDLYLAGRASERKKEVPLSRVEDQAYIHYSKGALVMYELQDAIGEVQVNRALARFLAAHKLKGPPYPTSRDFLAELEKEIPPDSKHLIDDLFNTITLWDNRAVSASYRDAGRDAYDVTVKFTAKKTRAGELGEETEVPVDDIVDVGVLAPDGKPLTMERRHLKSGAGELTLRVAQLPGKAGIDPLNKLIDRRGEDNLVRVDRAP